MSLSRFLRSLFGAAEPEPGVELQEIDGTEPLPPTSPDAHDAGRLAAVTDDAGLAVYADFLTEQGDVRGELISVMLAGRSDRALELRQAHRVHLYGPVARQVVKEVDTVEALRGLDRYGAERVLALWDRGFLRGLAVAIEAEHADGATFDEVRDLLRHPSCARLEVLVLHGYALDGLGPVLAAAGPFPTVRELVIGDFDSDECEVSWAVQGRWPRLAGTFPGVRRLEVLQVLEIGPLPPVEVLDIRVAGEGMEGSVQLDWGPPGNLDALRSAVLHGCQVAELLAREKLPALTELAVGHEEVGPLVAALQSRPEIAARLEVLSLSGCVLDGVAPLVVALRPALTSLKTFVVPDDYDHPLVNTEYGDLVEGYGSPHFYEGLWE